MPLSSKYRWIIVGKITIRNRKNPPNFAPSFTLDDLIEAIKIRIDNYDGYRSYTGDDSRVMWCDNLEDIGEYCQLLIQTGDKNVSGVSFLDFNTLKSRDIEKHEYEGGHYASHVLIKKFPDEFGRYLVLVEKVPGIYLSSVKAHFGWLCNNSVCAKIENDENDKPRKFKPVIEIDGCQSKTIFEALRDGTLQDIEFVCPEKVYEDGLDEEPIVKDGVYELRLEIKCRVSENQAHRLPSLINQYLQKNFGGKRDNTKVYIRIKTEEQQIKRTEIQNVDEFLEETFVQNEVVTNFKQPLTQRYENLRSEMIEKMISIAEKIND